MTISAICAALLAFAGPPNTPEWNAVQLPAFVGELQVVRPLGADELLVGARAKEAQGASSATALLRCSRVRCERMKTPDMGGVNSISATPAREIWVGTSKGVLRWDGVAWTSFGAEHGLREVAVIHALARNDVWAAENGTWDGRQWTTATRLSHWDGRTWTAKSLDGVFQGWIAAIDASAADNVWFAGGHFDGKVYGQRPGVLQWNGRSVQRSDLTPAAFDPAETGRSVQTVKVLSNRDVWIGGRSGLLRHWNGAAWEKYDLKSEAGSPDGPGSKTVVQLIPVPQGMTFLGVGLQMTPSGGDQTVVIRGTAGQPAVETVDRADRQLLVTNLVMTDRAWWRVAAGPNRVWWRR